MKKGLTDATDIEYDMDFYYQITATVILYSMNETFKQLHSNSSFKGAAVQRELDLLLYNYKKRPEE